MALYIGSNKYIKCYKGSTQMSKAILDGTNYPFSSVTEVAPDDLSNLAIWLDGSISASVTLDSGYVSNWADQSGTVPANDFFQTTAAYRPTYNTSGLNSKGTIVFPTDSNRWLQNAFSLSASDIFCAIVMKASPYVGYTNSPHVVSTSTGTNNDYTGTGHFVPVVVNEDCDGIGTVMENTGLQDAPKAECAYTDGSWVTFMTSIDGGNSIDTYISESDGTGTYTLTASPRGSSIMTVGNGLLYYSSAFHPDSYYRFYGEIAEIVYCTSIPSASEIAGLKLYFENKWGV